MTAAVIESEPEQALVNPQRFSKKFLIIGGVCLLLLVIGGGVAAWLLLGKSNASMVAATHDETVDTFLEVPAMIVNLRSADGVPRLIKLRLMLVLTKASDTPDVTARLPVIIDSFQPFLRELRPEDLAGSAAIFRIKEELLVRANGAAGAGTISNVLIQDLIQQ